MTIEFMSFFFIIPVDKGVRRGNLTVDCNREKELIGWMMLKDEGDDEYEKYFS